MPQTLRPLTKIAILAAAVAVAAGIPAPASAQSLRGSQASIHLMYASAKSKGLIFFHSPGDVHQAGYRGRLAMLAFTDHVALHRGVSYPFVLPQTADFLETLAAKHWEQCAERLTVTSAARPTKLQPRNASPLTVHPTGMAIDLRKPKAGPCLKWLRNQLLDYERAGVIEATEEFRPAHFHIAVLRWRSRPVQYAMSGGDVAPTTKPAAESTATTAIAARVDTSPVAPAADSARRTAPRARSGAAEYTVRPGDTLWGIARRNDTSVERLRQLNGLRSTRLKPGQTLRLPNG